MNFCAEISALQNEIYNKDENLKQSMPSQHLGQASYNSNSAKDSQP